MRSEPTIIDPRHKRPLPSGRALARIMRQVLCRQHDAFLHNHRAFLANLPAQMPGLFDLLLPIFERYAFQGARTASNTVLVSTAIEKSSAYWRKSILTDFNVLAPQILAAARRMTFAFLDAFTKATSDMLREALAAAAQLGETGLELQRRLRAIFGPERAAVIGQTESSRVTHEGQRIADKESGVVEKRQWLASADACPLCLALDGKEVGMDEPFYIRPEGGPYATILGPPAHPRCACAVVGVF